MTFATATLRIAAGGIAWALHFAAIYGATALACARGAPEIVPPAIALATVLAGGACVAVALGAWRRREEFVDWLSGAMAAMGFFAILLQATPVLQVPACG